MNITELAIYPIKACRGIGLDSLDLATTGPRHDREFVLIDGNGNHLSQSRVAALATVSVALIDGGVRVDCEGASGLDIERRTEGDAVPVTYYGAEAQPVDQGDAAAKWFSEVLGRDCRLARLAQPFGRPLPLEEFKLRDGAPHETFRDVAPILLCNEASLDDLNGRLDSPVPMNRFRANIVVDGLDAWAEDDLETVSGGSAELTRMTVCERCIVTTTDQLTRGTVRGK